MTTGSLSSTAKAHKETLEEWAYGAMEMAPSDEHARRVLEIVEGRSGKALPGGFERHGGQRDAFFLDPQRVAEIAPFALRRDGRKRDRASQQR